MKIKFSSSPRSPQSDKECLLHPTSFLSYLNLFEMSDVMLCTDHLKLLENHVHL